MTTEQLLLWLAVFGNLTLLYYAIRIGFQAAKLFRKGDRGGATWKASAATAVAGLTVLFPWTLLSGDRGIGKLSLLICLLTPVVISAAKLWPSLRQRFARTPILIVDIAIISMIVAFVVSRNWAWFWSGAIVMAVVWIAGRKSVPRRHQTAVSQYMGLELKQLDDPFGWHRHDPNDPLRTLGWTRDHR